jgi:hypothetical protein
MIPLGGYAPGVYFLTLSSVVDVETHDGAPGDPPYFCE